MWSWMEIEYEIECAIENKSNVKLNKNCMWKWIVVKCEI